MTIKKLFPLAVGFIFCCLLQSCITKNKTSSISYYSIRQEYAQPTSENPIPENAKIVVIYAISAQGELTAIVHNRTGEIMTIDQTQSFFVDSDGRSMSYYDPTIRTTSTTDLSSSTKGVSVNLGSIFGALGVGGAIGQLANGINVGGSGTSGQSITEATYISDQPRVSLAPNSNGAMSKTFKVSALAHPKWSTTQKIAPSISQQDSPCRFSVCISYSFDNGETFEKLITNFYADAYMFVPLKSDGMVNDALQIITQSKPDLYNVPCFNLWFEEWASTDDDEEIFAIYGPKRDKNMLSNSNCFCNGIIYDYQ